MSRFFLGKNNITVKTAYFFLIILIVLVAAGCSPKHEQEEYITIGALLPLTGEFSDEGLRALGGIQLAKQEINENGGVLGKKLDIIVLNDKGDEEYIVQQYHALKQRGVVAVIGSSYSNVTKALAKAAEGNGMPIISPTATNMNVTQGRPNVFRAIFVDEYQAEAMASFARRSLAAKTALVLRNGAAEGYGLLADTFADFFRAYGGQVVAVERYDSQDDFHIILEKYKDEPPDAIYCAEDYHLAGNLVNTAYELGFEDALLLGADAWDGLLVYVYLSDAMKNVYYTSPFSFDDDDPAVAQFVRDYFSAFSRMPLREDLPPAANGHITAIKHAGASLLSIINDILDFSKIESGKLEIIPGEYLFSSLINDVISVIRMRFIDSGLWFAVRIDSRIPNALYGDEIRVRQILLNLLNNAVKYTKNGYVSFTVTGEETDENTFCLTMEVADSGKGIKEEDIEKIFSEFTQSDTSENRGVEGTGLGLPIARSLVRAMDGDIAVGSMPGKGSMFTVTLPQKIRRHEILAAVNDPDEKRVLIYAPSNSPRPRFPCEIQRQLKQARSGRLNY